MTAQQHPNVLGALSALADLAYQHRWLEDLKEPGRRQRTARPSMSAAAKAIADRQARAEKADQTATLKAGLKPSGGSAAPLDIGTLNAQMVAEITAHDAAIIASSELRREPMLAYPAALHGTNSQRFALAVAYLRVALCRVSVESAGQLGSELAAAARLCETAADHKPDRRPFLWGPCPACGIDRLESQTDATRGDFATATPAFVMCVPSCKCRGFDCLCRRPVREPGLRHMWPSAEFGQLKARIEEAMAA